MDLESVAVHWAVMTTPSIQYSSYNTIQYLTVTDVIVIKQVRRYTMDKVSLKIPRRTSFLASITYKTSAINKDFSPILSYSKYSSPLSLKTKLICFTTFYI